MQKVIILLSLLIFNFTSFSQTLPDPPVQQSSKTATIKSISHNIRLSYDTSISAWDTVRIVNYSYNPTLTEVEIVYRSKINGDWKLTDKVLNYGYWHNPPDSVLSEKWDENLSIWNKQTKIIYKYNNNFEEEEVISYSYVSSSSQYQKRSHYTYFFDATGNNTGYIFRSFNNSGMLQSSDSMGYSLDPNGNILLEDRYYWSLADNTWKPALQKIHTYDSNNKVISSIYKLYMNGSYFNINKTNYSYNNQQLIYQKTYQDWEMTINEWEDADRETYSYNNQNLQDTLLTENIFGTIWKPSNRYIFTYDADGDRIETKGEFFTNNAWTDLSISQIFYVEGVGIKTFIKNDPIIFPNPNNGAFTIKLNDKDPADVKIVSTTGAIIFSGKVHEQKKFDLNTLPSGVYFIEIKTSTGTFIQKAIINF